MNPEVQLYDVDEAGQEVAWTPSPTAMQRYLWRLYEWCIDRVAEIAKGDPVHVFHNGDLTQGKTYADHLVSTRMGDQLLIAVANMQVWFERPDLNIASFRLTQGTGSHIFREGTSTMMTAKALRDMFPDQPIRNVRHGLATIDDVKIDYAHHGPSAGIREWTEGNQLRYYAKSLVIGDVLRGKTPPRLVARGHFHEWSRETVRVAKRYTADIILLPSMCGMGEYGRQATGSKAYVTNGIVVVELIDGRIEDFHPLVKELGLRTEEDLSG
jgi:hypothetical protein